MWLLIFLTQNLRMGLRLSVKCHCLFLILRKKNTSGFAVPEIKY